MALFVNAILKLRGAEKWPETEGTVYSCTWESDAGTDAPGGVTRLVYTYRSGDDLLTGESVWEDPKGLDKYRPGDVIIIRVDPKRTARSYFPEKQDLDAPFLFALIAGVAALLLFGLFAMITGGEANK